MKQPEIYIHVGMGRTGSTFLQHQVFPKIRGLYFSRKTKIKHAGEVIGRAEYDKYLVSDELDNRFIESSLTGFAAEFKQARPIVVLRRQDEWILSQYKRYLKNGYHWSFNEFLDIKDNLGFIKKEHLYFHAFLSFLGSHFQQKPLVLLYDDFRKDPRAFIRRMVDYMGADIPLERINLSPRHVSYDARQLRALYRISGAINLTYRKQFAAKWKNKLLNLLPDLLRHMVLYGSLLCPAKCTSGEDILPSSGQLKKIRDFYRDDWEKCLACAERI